MRSSIRARRNWGRWGKDDQRGAINLITSAKRVAAARLVTSGRSVSLSRPFPKEPAPNNGHAAQRYVKTHPRGRGGFAADYYGISYHGFASTHIDALCHTWDEDGMWNGRNPAKEVTFDGAAFGGIVHGWELEDIVTKRGIRLEPGDAICVYSGREAWQAENPDKSYGRAVAPALQERPGLHVSCLSFLRDHDVSVVVWDMIDHSPIGYDVSWAVHSAIYAYGVALVDNALLEPLARACIEEGRDEFMLTIAPLVVNGGTGSPANPIAVF